MIQNTPPTDPQAVPAQATAPAAVISTTPARGKINRVAASAIPVTESHHRAFKLPDNGGVNVVVAIEQQDSGDAEQHLFLGARAWEVDDAGNDTGLHAPLGTHSIPHGLLQDSTEMAKVVELLTNEMIARVIKRQTAINSVDAFPIKKLPKEIAERKPQFPYPLLRDAP